MIAVAAAEPGCASACKRECENEHRPTAAHAAREGTGPKRHHQACNAVRAQCSADAAQQQRRVACACPTASQTASCAAAAAAAAAAVATAAAAAATAATATTTTAAASAPRLHKLQRARHRQQARLVPMPPHQLHADRQRAWRPGRRHTDGGQAWCRGARRASASCASSCAGARALTCEIDGHSQHVVEVVGGGVRGRRCSKGGRGRGGRDAHIPLPQHTTTSDDR